MTSARENSHATSAPVTTVRKRKRTKSHDTVRFAINFMTFSAFYEQRNVFEFDLSSPSAVYNCSRAVPVDSNYHPEAFRNNGESSRNCSTLYVHSILICSVQGVSELTYFSIFHVL